VGRFERLVMSHLPAGGVVAILGLSYKPATPVVEESQSLELARRLAEAGTPVVAYDPAAMGAAQAVLGEKVTFAASANECAHSADVLVLATPWEEFRRLDPTSIKAGATVLDCWRLLPSERFAARARHVVLGQGS
jgi:UDPglucose 6-dehydrogenase